MATPGTPALSARDARIPVIGFGTSLLRDCGAIVAHALKLSCVDTGGRGGSRPVRLRGLRGARGRPGGSPGRTDEGRNLGSFGAAVLEHAGCLSSLGAGDARAGMADRGVGRSPARRGDSMGSRRQSTFRVNTLGGGAPVYMSTICRSHR